MFARLFKGNHNAPVLNSSSSNNQIELSSPSIDLELVEPAQPKVREPSFSTKSRIALKITFASLLGSNMGYFVNTAWNFRHNITAFDATPIAGTNLNCAYLCYELTAHSNTELALKPFLFLDCESRLEKWYDFLSSSKDKHLLDQWIDTYSSDAGGAVSESRFLPKYAGCFEALKVIEKGPGMWDGYFPSFIVSSIATVLIGSCALARLEDRKRNLSTSPLLSNSFQPAEVSPPHEENKSGNANVNSMAASSSMSSHHKAGLWSKAKPASAIGAVPSLDIESNSPRLR